MYWYLTIWDKEQFNKTSVANSYCTYNNRCPCFFLKFGKNLEFFQNFSFSVFLNGKKMLHLLHPLNEDNFYLEVKT